MASNSTKRIRENALSTCGIMVLQSFSKKEFNPDNPADILTVNMLGQEFVREHYPDRQAVVFTQTDGKSGLIHNHVLINDVSLENGKGCNKEQYWDSYVQRWTEEITQRYTTLDRGEKARALLHLHADRLLKDARGDRTAQKGTCKVLQFRCCLWV